MIKHISALPAGMSDWFSALYLKDWRLTDSIWQFPKSGEHHLTVHRLILMVCCNLRQITFTVRGHTASHQSNRPSESFISCFSFGFIYQAETLSAWAFKTKGLGEPAFKGWDDQLTKEEKLYISMEIKNLPSLPLYLQKLLFGANMRHNELSTFLQV